MGYERAMSTNERVGGWEAGYHFLQCCNANCRQCRTHNDSSCCAYAGGLGTLGRLITRWLQQQSVARVQLISRSGRAGESGRLEAALLSGSCTAVTISMADMGVSEDLSGALRSAAQGGVALQGILHAAGVLADATIAKQTLEGTRAVFASKVHPVKSWAGAIAMQPTSTQVLFSSVAALLGAPGQLNYSGANAALDSMAQHAQAQVSILALSC